MNFLTCDFQLMRVSRTFEPMLTHDESRKQIGGGGLQTCEPLLTYGTKFRHHNVPFCLKGKQRS